MYSNAKWYHQHTILLQPGKPKCYPYSKETQQGCSKCANKLESPAWPMARLWIHCTTHSGLTVPQWTLCQSLNAPILTWIIQTPQSSYSLGENTVCYIQKRTGALFLSSLKSQFLPKVCAEKYVNLSGIWTVIRVSDTYTVVSRLRKIRREPCNLSLSQLSPHTDSHCICHFSILYKNEAGGTCPQIFWTLEPFIIRILEAN